MIPSKIRNNLLVKLFYLLFGISMILALSFILKEVENTQFLFYQFAYVCLYVTFIVACQLAIGRVNPLKRSKKVFTILSIIIFIGILLRLCALCFLQTEPISDFKTPHAFYQYYYDQGPYAEIVPWSERDTFQLYYSRFPAWYLYMRIVMLIYNIFGENLLWIHVLDMLLAAGTIVAIYFLVKKIANDSTALLAALLFATNPSLILYSCITTPDHFTILLFVLTFVFWVQAEENRSEWYRKPKTIAYLLATILCCMMVNFFKPLSVFFLIVFVCYEIAVHLYPAVRDRIGMRIAFHDIISYELSFVGAFLILLVASNTILNHSIEKMMKTEVVQSTGLYLLWGYSVNEMGEYDPNVATEVFLDLMEQYDNNLPVVLEEIDGLAIEQIKDNFDLLPKIFREKYYLAFGGEYGYFGFSNTSANTEYMESITKVFQKPITAILIAAMRILYVLSLIYAVLSIKDKKINKYMLLLSITIFGYILVLVLGGVQSRYKSLVVPLWCILSAYMFERVRMKFTTEKNLVEVEME